MNVRTRLYAGYHAWVAAGSPAGGIIPVGTEAFDLRLGDRWPVRYLDRARHGELQTYYVALPTGQLWCPWQRAYSAENGYHGEGWEISGAIEHLTVTPSIAVDGWHGWLTNGELVAA